MKKTAEDNDNAGLHVKSEQVTFVYEGSLRFEDIVPIGRLELKPRWFIQLR